MTVFGALLYQPRPYRSLPPPCHLASARILRRLFCRAAQRADPAPAAAGTQGRRDRRGESCSRSWACFSPRAHTTFSRAFCIRRRARNFPRWRRAHARHHGLLDLSAARFARCGFVLWAADAFRLPHPRRRARQHSRNRRRAVRREPHVVRRRAAADRFHRPADPLPDVQGHLRSAVRQAVRENDSRHSDFFRAAPARNAAIAARSEQRDSSTAKSSAFSPKDRSRASASCFPSAAAWSAS